MRPGDGAQCGIRRYELQDEVESSIVQTEIEIIARYQNSVL